MTGAPPRAAHAGTVVEGHARSRAAGRPHDADHSAPRPHSRGPRFCSFSPSLALSLVKRGENRNRRRQRTQSAYAHKQRNSHANRWLAPATITAIFRLRLGFDIPWTRPADRHRGARKWAILSAVGA